MSTRLSTVATAVATIRASQEQRDSLVRGARDSLESTAKLGQLIPRGRRHGERRATTRTKCQAIAQALAGLAMAVDAVSKGEWNLIAEPDGIMRIGAPRGLERDDVELLQACARASGGISQRLATLDTALAPICKARPGIQPNYVADHLVSSLADVWICTFQRWPSHAENGPFRRDLAAVEQEGNHHTTASVDVVRRVLESRRSAR